MNIKLFRLIFATLLFSKAVFSQTIIPVTAIPAITHVSCLNGTNGSIKLNNVTGGSSGTYSYAWSPGGLTTNPVTTQSVINNYYVTITGTAPRGSIAQGTYQFNIGYKTFWENSYGGMITNSTGDTLIQARTDHASTWLETSNSSNILSGSTNGWVEYVVTNTGYNKIFGLVDSVGTGWNNIDFAMILNSGGTVNTVNNGSQVSLGTYTIGDVLRIERAGSTIIYSKNNTAMSTLTITTAMTQARLTVRGALYDYGARLENLGCSFPATNISAKSSNIISCSALTSTLTGTTTIVGGTYTWSPGGSTPNSFTTSVTSGGTYSLSITTPTFGCVLTNTVAVVSTAANVSITNSPTLTCTSPTAVLTGGSTTSGATYSWSPGGATTSTLNVTTAGTFTLKVTNPANGCTATATVAVTTNTTPPNVSIVNSPTLTCTVPTAVLTGSSTTSGATYSWSPGGATTSTLNVTTAGTFTLKVTNPANGCTATATVAVTTNTTLPNVSIVNSPTLTCTAPTAVLTGSSTTSGATYSWSPGGVTTSTLNVTTAGTYTLKVTNPANGCTATATVAITSNTTLPNIGIVNSPTLTCSAPTAVLTGSSSTTGATYSWSPGGVTTSTLNVTTAGTFTLKVTNPANGCTATATVAVTTNTTLPNVNIVNSPTLTCTVPTAVLTGSSTTSGATYSWSPGGVTTSTLNVTTAGTYTLNVTNPTSGCSATATIAVTTNTTIPNIGVSTNNSTITCSIPTAVLTGSSSTTGVTYSWSPVGATTSTLSLTTAGTYTLKVTNPANGCTATATVAITSNTTLPNVSAGSNQTITASNPSVTLTGSSTTSGVTYSWTPAGSSPTSSINVVSTRGIYSLTVTNPINGCVASSTVSVIAKLDVLATIQDYISDSLKGTVNLTITGGTPPYNIAWNGSKLPTSLLAYHKLINSFSGISIDSVKFKNEVDSIRQNLVNNKLLPGTYSVTIYDNVNDSIVSIIYVGEKTNSWAYTMGVETTSCSIANKSISNINYNYGNGQQMRQSGSYVAGQHFAIPQNIIDFNDNNEISFVIPSVLDICYVGLQETKSQVNGSIDDIAQRTMFRFNGAANFNIIINGTSIYSGSFHSGDNFTLRTNSSTGSIAYHQNEALLIQSDFAVINTVPSYLPKIVFGSSGATVSGFKVIKNLNINYTYINKNLSYVKGQVIDVTCGNPCSGSIIANGHVFLGAPDHYDLYLPGSASPFLTIPAVGLSSVTFPNLCAGIYTVKYYAMVTPIYQLGTTSPTPYMSAPVVQTFEVGYMPDWVAQANVSVNSTDHSLTRSLNTFAWDAGASSINTLLSTDNGWIEWTAPTNYAVNGIGLSTQDIDKSITSINYGIGNAKIPINFFGGIIDFNYFVLTQNQTMINAIQAYKPGGNFAPNDVFRIEKNIIGGVSSLTFKKNNQPIGTPITISSGNNLILDASLQLFNGVISHPRVSFSCIEPEKYAELKKDYDGGYHVTKYGILKFKYTEEYNRDNLDFKIYNFKRQLITTNPLLVAKNEGDNRYSIKFTGTVPSGIYYLEVLNGKGEKMVLKFKI